MSFMKRLALFIFLLISFCVNAQLSKVVPDKPVPPRLVNDFANMLTPEQQQALENKLVAYDDSTSSQIAVVTVESLEGYEDEEYALALGRKWGVGGKEFNNGIVVLISKNDRKSRIEVGYGLEGAIPDITAKTIIENELLPSFREGNYYRGLDRATDALIKAAAGEYKGTGGAKKGNNAGKGFAVIVFFLIMVFLFAAGRRGGGGRGGGMMSRRGYRDFGAGWILGSLIENATRGGGGRGWGGGGGWSGGGGGGGGFGGFGGGGFGGGGASGSW